jgi:ubiquinone/menaquinone biosynthesis C-methylase UbiE
MTHNIYDDPEFFKGYNRLSRSIQGLAGAAEWPAMQAMLPDMHGLKIVDLGCGFGWFCRWAREQGAAQVLGLDGSENMLSRARSATSDPLITYERVDLEHLSLPDSQFDLAYSSLALHYIEDMAGLFATVFRALMPGGYLVFSLEHPIYMAPTHPAWSMDKHGHKTWPLKPIQRGRSPDDELAGRGSGQAASYPRDHPQPSDPLRVYDHPCRGMEPDSRANCGEAGFG